MVRRRKSAGRVTAAEGSTIKRIIHENPGLKRGEWAGLASEALGRNISLTTVDRYRKLLQQEGLGVEEGVLVVNRDTRSPLEIENEQLRQELSKLRHLLKRQLALIMAEVL